ncbi:MAG TPA: CvpA family protein [Terracidiphilus sp.]|jgi:membrane protein required for colicin V production
MTDSGMMWIDWAIVLVVALAVLGGLAQGFFRSVCSLGGLILGLALAAWNYPIIAAPLNRLVHSEEIADIIGFLLIALLVMTIAGILGNFLAKALHSIGLGCLDRIAGGVFGFFQGVLLVTLAILVTVAFYPQAHWLVEARLPRHFFAACHLSTHMSPEQLAQRVRTGLRTLEGETPVWLHPHEGKS